MRSLLLYFLLIVYPFIAFYSGKITLSLLRNSNHQFLPYRYYILIGILANNYLILALKYLGCSWMLATSIVWFYPVIIFIKNFKLLSFQKFNFKYNFGLFFLVNLIIGLTLFDVDEGIKTYWSNNYGDLTFHIGMISALVFGDQFPPDFHLYAGTKLTYPFIINFWTASFWWINPTWISLKIIFVFQWVLITSLIYGFLRGNKFKFAPWLVIFGGGVYLSWNLPTGKLIDSGLPWVGFLEAIWVTQRSALFGALCLIAIIPAFFRVLISKTVDLSQIYFASVVVLFLPLVNTHTWIVAFFSSLLVLFTFILSSEHKIKIIKELTLPFVIIFSSLLFIFLLEEKTSGIALLHGWQTGNLENHWINQTIFSGFKTNPFLLKIIFWLVNAWNLILVFLILAWRLKAWRLVLTGIVLLILFWLLNLTSGYFIAQVIITVFFAGFLLFLQSQLPAKVQILSLILILFIFGNFIRLSFWDFDQIKIFLPTYLVLVLAWSMIVPSRSRLNLALIILLIPGIYRVNYFFKTSDHFVVFSNAQIKEASEIRELVPASAVIANNPTHNSTILLTGRQMYMGYPGTLWSHGLAYQEREKILKNILNDPCQDKICPDYLYRPDGDNYFYSTEKTNPEFKLLKNGLYQITK